MSSPLSLKYNFASATKVITAYYELTKPRITYLVVFSMGVGYLMGLHGNPIQWHIFINAIIGTFMIAGGTAAQNQVIERNHDKLMTRTRKRPLPTNRISAPKAMIFSFSMIMIGFTWLVSTVNFTAAATSLLTTILYLCAYTPLKRVNFSNVLIGAVPGALPPVGGWAAATGSIDAWAPWLLFGIVFLWQMPHVMAIAWVCKEDYDNAGFKMLPNDNSSHSVTRWFILINLLALIPVTIGLYLTTDFGYLYLVGAILSALYFIWAGYKFFKVVDDSSAKKLMYASFGYLPLVWLFILTDMVLQFIF